MKNQRILILVPLFPILFLACSLSPPSQPTDVPTDELATRLPWPTPLEDPVNPLLVPEENTVYLGIYHWMPAVSLTGGKGTLFFNQIENPQVVYVSDEEIELLDDFTFDFTYDNEEHYPKIYLLLSFNTDTEPPSIQQRLIEVNLDTLESKEIWTYLVDTVKYGEYSGKVGFDQLYVDSVLILEIFNCYACDSTTPPGQILVNTDTGEEKFLGSVGDISINTVTNTISYRRVETFYIPCDIEFFGGSCPYYGGVGEFITEELP